MINKAQSFKDNHLLEKANEVAKLLASYVKSISKNSDS